MTSVMVMPTSRVRAAANDEAHFSKGTAALSDSPPALFRNRAVANSYSSLQRELAYSGIRAGIEITLGSYSGTKRLNSGLRSGGEAASETPVDSSSNPPNCRTEQTISTEHKLPM